MKRSLPGRLTFSIPRGLMEMHILRMLDTPHYGYEIIKRIEDGCSYWKPSPGSVYPILQKLQKAGLVSEKDSGKRKVYSVTRAGRGRIKRFDTYKNEIREKMVEIFRMMGEEDHIHEFTKGFEIFEKIRKDPAKLRKAAKLRRKFMEDLQALSEE